MIEALLNLPVTKDPAMKDFQQPVYSFKSAYYSKRENSKIHTVIIQSTKRKYIENIKFYKNPETKQSAHFTINKKGQIFQHVKISDWAHLTYNAQEKFARVLPNPGSIIIDIAGREDAEDAFLKPQIESTKNLITYLNKKYAFKMIRWKGLDKKYQNLQRISSLIKSEDKIPLFPYDLNVAKALLVAKKTEDPAVKNCLKKIHWYPSPCSYNRGANCKIDTLYLFPTRKNLSSSIKKYLHPYYPESAHFTIDRDGTIIQHVDTKKRAALPGLCSDEHFNCKTRNSIDSHGIGIGFVTRGEQKNQYPKAQIDSLRYLINYLKTYYNIQQISRQLPAHPSDREFRHFPWLALGIPKAMIPTHIKAKRLSNDPAMIGFNHRVYSMPAVGPGTAKTLNFSNRFNNPKIDTIVLHSTDGPLGPVNRWFMNPKAKVTSHFTIDKDGLLVQHADLKYRCKHAGSFTRSKDRYGRTDVNNFSIGIELVHEGNGKHPYPKKQLRTLKKLLTYLVKKYPIKDITSHQMVAMPRGRKVDPVHFPWDTLKRGFSDYLYYKS